MPRHPWIVVSQTGKTDQVVIVNLSSNPGDNNPAFTVQPHEHPSISKPSHLRCERARLAAPSALQQLIDLGKLQLSRPVSDELLARVKRALLESSLTPLEVKKCLS